MNFYVCHVSLNCFLALREHMSIYPSNCTFLKSTRVTSYIALLRRSSTSLRPSRIVFISSNSYESSVAPDYALLRRELPNDFTTPGFLRRGIARYQVSKVCNIYYALELSSRIAASVKDDEPVPVLVNCCHPGSFASSSDLSANNSKQASTAARTWATLYSPPSLNRSSKASLPSCHTRPATAPRPAPTWQLLRMFVCVGSQPSSGRRDGAGSGIGLGAMRRISRLWERIR
jgi:hypothetical protein